MKLFSIEYSIADHRGTTRLIPISEDAKFLCEVKNSKTITAAVLHAVARYYPNSYLYTTAENNGRYGFGLLPTIGKLTAEFGPLYPDKLRQIERNKDIKSKAVQS